MNYRIEGHPHRHAVEELLLHLLPDRTVSEGEDTGGEFCRSSLTLADGELTALASVRLDGVTYTGERRGACPAEELARRRVENELIKLSLYDAVAPTLAERPVWGSLTGVRPAKLARGLIERGRTPAETERYLIEHFDVSPARAALAMSAAQTALDLDRTLSSNGVSLYVGIPFCPTRCYYCSFISSAVEKNAALIEPYVDALCDEAADAGMLLRERGLRLDSLYIGGGTPTTLSAEQLHRLLSALEDAFELSRLRDFTVEAGRPDTITREKLAVLRGHGVDRVSVNPQSMDDEVLRLVGRRHTAAEVIRAFETARELGFPVINMDVIAGLAGDDPARFARTMDTLIGLGTENITVHTLAVKRGAELSDIAANLAQRETVQRMLAYGNRALEDAGYRTYYLYRQKFSAGGFENVGWCRPGDENFYNVAMMEELQTILSLGAGGVSKRVDRDTGKVERFTNPKYPAEYLSARERIAAGKRALLERPGRED